MQPSAYLSLHPLRHDPPRHAVRRPVGIPRQIQPLAQLDLRHQQEDRHGGQPAPGFRAGRHRAAPGVQAPFGDQQAGSTATKDKAQAKPGAALPFTGGDATAFAALACSRCWDRQSEPVFRPDQRTGVMRADDHRGLGPDQRRRVQAVAGFGEAGEADAVSEPRAQPRTGDLAPPCGFQGGARFAHGGGHRLFPGGDFGLHQGRNVGTDVEFELHHRCR